MSFPGVAGAAAGSAASAAPGARGGRRKTAAERRQQANSADARRFLWACKSLSSTRDHRGGGLGRFGCALLQALRASQGSDGPFHAANVGTQTDQAPDWDVSPTGFWDPLGRSLHLRTVEDPHPSMGAPGIFPRAPKDTQAAKDPEEINAVSDLVAYPGANFAVSGEVVDPAEIHAVSDVVVDPERNPVSTWRVEGAPGTPCQGPQVVQCHADAKEQHAAVAEHHATGAAAHLVPPGIICVVPMLHVMGTHHPRDPRDTQVLERLEVLPFASPGTRVDGDPLRWPVTGLSDALHAQGPAARVVHAAQGTQVQTLVVGTPRFERLVTFMRARKARRLYLLFVLWRFSSLPVPG